MAHLFFLQKETLTSERVDSCKIYPYIKLTKNALLGEDPNVEGFYHCCGFNSSGMMLGGGCGDQMAKWIKHGRPEFDMFGYDIRRFYEPLNKNLEWVSSRSHEAYAKNYAIVFPNDEPLAGRGIRKSPVYNVRFFHSGIF